MSHKIDEARDRLLCEAKKVLISDGYRNLNIRSLVSSCKISIGTFYNNFQSKEDLAVTLLNSDWKIILDAIDQIGPQNLSFEGKLRKIYLLIHDFFKNYKNVFLDIMAESSAGKNGNAEIKRAFCEKMGTLIQSEIDCGNIRISVDAAKLAYFILQNFIYMGKEDYLSFDEFYRCLNLA